MNNQKGVTLIELILVLALMAYVTVLGFAQKQLSMEQDRAKEVGTLLFSYNNAVRSWISENAATIPSIHVREGTTWLKPHSCGGVTSRVDGYLPCNVPDATPASPILFGQLSLKTTITATLLPDGSRRIDSTATSTPFSLPGRNGNELRSDLAGIAALTGAAGGMTLNSPLPAATDSSFKSSPTSGIITIRASTNGALDAWLRTDGSNQMHNNITFNPLNPQEMRQVRNVSRIQNIASQALNIGNPGGATQGTPFMVVVDADQKIYGRLMVNNMTGFPTAMEINKGDLAVSDGDVNLKDGDVIIKEGDLEAKKGIVTAQAFYDADNEAYFLNPAELTELKKVRVEEPLEIKKTVVRGTACPTLGAISRDSAGAVMSCYNGLWQHPGGTPGMYGYFNASSCPHGWTQANGSNGTVNLRGAFVRSLDAGAGRDPGRALGSYQADALKRHRHDFVTPGGKRFYVINDSNSRPSTTDRNAGAYRDDGPNQSNDGQWYPYTSYSGTADESRPKNVALLACMKI